jgi:hypothetical protein
MSRKILAILGVGALVLALPVFAGDEDDADGGFFVGVEATSLKPNSGSTPYVLSDPDDDFVAEGEIRSVEFDNEIAPRVTLGWMGGGGGVWYLSWWNWDDDGTDSVTAMSPAQLWDILYHAEYAIEEFEGTASARAGMDATIMNFGYSYPLTNNGKLSTRWTTGIRSASIEQDLDIIYAEDMGTTEVIRRNAEAEGMGVFGGLRGNFKLSDKWMVMGGMTYSFLAGEVEASNLEYSGGDPNDPDADVFSERDRTFTILEAQCTLVWHPTDMLYLWLGVEYAQWSNVVDMHTFPDDVDEGFIETNTTGVTWDGFTLGIGFTF